MDNHGLITAYLLDRHGSGQKLSWDGINAWRPAQGLLWVHLDYTDDSAVQWLSEKSNIDPIVVEALTLDESRPRSVEYPDGLLVFLRGINLNPGQDPEDMVSIRVWMEKDRIITTRHRRLLSVGDIEDDIKNKRGPNTSGEFLTVLSRHLVERMDNALDDIDDQIDALEDNVILASSHDLRSEISDIRRQSIMIRRYLAPQREALYQLQLYKHRLLTSKNLLQLREVTDHIIRYIENLDSARDRAAIIQEELSSRLSEQINSRMYTLSMVAMIFLPLTFITGLLGINVGGIPGSSSERAFVWVCIGLAVLTVFMVLFFRRKKWM